MFKTNHLAGVLNFRNGGSVPSIGGTPSLASALAAFERAEAVLESARATARAAARREGRSVAGLFEKSNFIRRATGERWADEARLAGVRTGCDLVVRGLTMAEDPPFQHLAKRLKQPGSMERQRAVAAKLDAAGFQDALDVGDYDEAARIAVQVRREEEAGHVTGERIVAAGKRARMSADAAGELPEPEKGSFAAKVIECGKRRRGEI